MLLRANLDSRGRLALRSLAAPVQRGSMHTELPRQVGDPELPLFDRRFDHDELCSAELRWATAAAPVRLRNGQSGVGALEQPFTLELGDATEYGEEKLSSRSAQIDSLFEEAQADVALSQILDEFEKVPKGAADAVQGPRHQDVLSSQEAQRPVELRSSSVDAGGDLLEDLRAASGLQRNDLLLQILRRSGNPRVSDQHGRNVAKLVVEVQMRYASFATTFATQDELSIALFLRGRKIGRFCDATGEAR